MLRSLHKNLLFILILVCSLTVDAAGKKTKKSKAVQTIYGVVQSCHDGDTCHVLIEKIPVSSSEKVKVRLSGIDAPEIKQADGTKAKNFLELLVKDRKVELKCDGQSFDRRVCKMLVDGLDVNAEMVKNGWAWESVKYSKGEYKKFQSAAKFSKLGLWKGKDIVSPYCFRHKKNKKCKNNLLYME